MTTLELIRIYITKIIKIKDILHPEKCHTFPVHLEPPEKQPLNFAS